MRIAFVRRLESLSVGKRYASSDASPVTARGDRSGALVATHVIDRSQRSCDVGAAGAFAPEGGFDRVDFSGSVFGMTELEACDSAR